MTKENYNNLESKAYEHYMTANLTYDISNEKQSNSDITLYNASILNAYTCLHQICAYFAWKNDIEINNTAGHHKQLLRAVNKYLYMNYDDLAKKCKDFFDNGDKVRLMRNEVAYQNEIFNKKDCKEVLEIMEMNYNYIRSKL